MLAALFLIGYLASFFHEVTVRHTLCVEHGEWVHEAEAVDAAELTASDFDSAPHVQATQRSSVAPHDHCSIVVASRESRGVAPSSGFELANFAPEVGVVVDLLHAIAQDERVSTSFARGPPSIV